jgi:hypothetical protein
LPFSYPFKGLGYTLAQCPVFWDHFTAAIHNPLRRWISTSILLPGGNRLAKNWRFDITRQEAEVIVREAEGIRAQQREAATRTGVSLVLSSRDAFLTAPWTFGMNGHLPNASATAGWDPSTWEPYAYEAKARAIRTFNDSLLTQQDLDKHVDFRGTAHPNLTGHRLLADTIMPCATAILQGHGNGNCRERP